MARPLPAFFSQVSKGQRYLHLLPYSSIFSSLAPSSLVLPSPCLGCRYGMNPPCNQCLNYLIDSRKISGKN